MQNRQQQTIRPKEEQWLIDAIIEKDTETAEKVITIIQEKTPQFVVRQPRLDSNDDAGNSFLFLSIVNNARSIANLLFSLQKDNDAILLGKNKKNQTLIWQAAKSQNNEMLEKLLIVTRSHYQKNRLNKKPWLEADLEGNTPLHAAIAKTEVESVTCLLNVIQQTVDPEEWILQLNKTNKIGNTPLHVAMKKKNIDVAALLIKNGADCTVINSNNESPFDYFCGYNLIKQKQLISALLIEKKETNKNNYNKENQIITMDRAYQTLLLDLYQQKLMEKKQNTSKACYLSLAAHVSLKSLIFANAMTDNRFRQELTTNKNAIFSHSDAVIEMDYNVDQDTILIDINDDNKIKIDHPHPLIEDRRLPDYKQINTDRSMLIDLIAAIDAYVTDLEHNPRLSERKRALSVLLPVIGWLIFWGVEGWFIYDHVRAYDTSSCKNTSYDGTWCRDDDNQASLGNQMRTDLQLIFFNVFGAPAAIANSISFPYFCWQTERAISKEEWIGLIILLEKNVLGKLRELSSDQVPIDHQATLAQLQTEINGFRNNQPRQEVIDIFKHISSILNKIQTNLNLGYYRNGITLFKPVESDFVILDSPRGFKMTNTTRDADDETDQLLLGQHQATYRYGGIIN